MNLFNIENAFKLKKDRGWDYIYVAIDLHGTLIKPYHSTIEFYPGAVEVMKWFNSRPEFRTILWTSSYPNEVMAFLKTCRDQQIYFNFVNDNPMQKSSERADFSKKFYFMILLDDKAGFEGEKDWLAIKQELIRLGEWNTKINWPKDYDANEV